MYAILKKMAFLCRRERTMDNDKLINYGKKYIEAIDKFLSDDGEGCDFLQRTYTMVQANSHNPVKITEESRRRCAKSLVR